VAKFFSNRVYAMKTSVSFRQTLGGISIVKGLLPGTLTAA